MVDSGHSKQQYSSLISRAYQHYVKAWRTLSKICFRLAHVHATFPKLIQMTIYQNYAEHRIAEAVQNPLTPWDEIFQSAAGAESLGRGEVSSFQFPPFPLPSVGETSPVLAQCICQHGPHLPDSQLPVPNMAPRTPNMGTKTPIIEIKSPT